MAYQRKTHLFGAAQPGAQFIQLEVGDLQGVEAVLMQRLCMFPCTSEPGGEGGLPGAEDPLGSRWVQPFGQCRQYHGDLV
jgi:hypothetical protein